MNLLFAADISFNFVGDYPGDAQARRTVLGIEPLFRAADFSVVNLENVLGDANAYAPISFIEGKLSSVIAVALKNAFSPTLTKLSGKTSFQTVTVSISGAPSRGCASPSGISGVIV